MREFFRKSLIFVTPWLIYAMFLLVVDPYDYVNISHVVPDSVKRRTSYPLNYTFWKMTHFARNPCPNILLGDSRMDALAVDRIHDVSGQEYCNLAYGGGTLKEIVETFWFANSRSRLKSVVIGVNFNIYNENSHADRTELYRLVSRNPLLYFTNTTVVRASMYNLYYDVTGRDPHIGTPPMDKDQFWKVQLGPITDSFYADYIYPSKLRGNLRDVAAYCRANGIELVFVIFPTHVELQDRVRDYRLTSEYRSFKSDLSAMATTYDYDFASALTSDKANFKDPYHFDGRVADLIISELWTGQVRFGKKLRQAPLETSGVSW